MASCGGFLCLQARGPAAGPGSSGSFGAGPTPRFKPRRVTELPKWTSSFAMALDSKHHSRARSEEAEIIRYSCSPRSPSTGVLPWRGAWGGVGRSQLPRGRDGRRAGGGERERNATSLLFKQPQELLAVRHHAPRRGGALRACRVGLLQRKSISALPGRGETAGLACGGLRGPRVWSGLPWPACAPSGVV